MDHKDDKIWLMQGDCLEHMKEIPDDSVDMILTDPHSMCDIIDIP